MPEGLAAAKRRKARGQMEAPIELFVAIVVLASSMALAFYVMGQTEEGKCIATLKTETEKLQAAMLDVAFASPPTSRTVLFNMPRCGNTIVEGLQFVYYSDPEYCRLCPAHYGGCWQIVPIARDKEGMYHAVSQAVSCVNMAGDIWIEEDEDCEGLSSEPCPPEEPNCKIDVPRGVWSEDPLESRSRWVTMGKLQGVSVYKIVLTKGVSLKGGEEVGLIKVCVEKPS